MSTEQTKAEKVLAISECFELLAWEPANIPDWLAALAQAARNGEWGLIRESVESFAAEELPSDKKARLKAETLAIVRHIATAPELYDCPPTKRDILDILQKHYPEHFNALPPSESGMRLFWKEAGTESPQSRGSDTRPVKIYDACRADLGFLIQRRLESAGE